MTTTSATQNDRAAWLKGPSCSCSCPPQTPTRIWRLVLLGAPGVGKGTQAELLCTFLGTCHLSTGDIFRAAKSADASCDRTPAMTAALDYMKRGDLVPDDTVVDLVRERLACLRCLGGLLLDGFPRTVPQAQALQNLLHAHHLQLDGVLDYQLPLDEIVARLSGRRTCSHCKSVYHLTSRPPQRKNLCDHCGNKLLQREDDRPEAIRTRMAAYEKSTSPLTDFYKKQNLLVPIPAVGTPDEIYQRTLTLLQSHTPPASPKPQTWAPAP